MSFWFYKKGRAYSASIPVEFLLAVTCITAVVVISRYAARPQRIFTDAVVVLVIGFFLFLVSKIHQFSKGHGLNTWGRKDMKKPYRWLYVLGYVLMGIGVLMVVFFTLITKGDFLGKNTEYCPPEHRISDTSSCVVLDKLDDRVLIQHADLDTNENYFEIISGNTSEKYEMPFHITRLAPSGYEARLIDNDYEAILINGKRHVLEARREE